MQRVRELIFDTIIYAIGNFLSKLVLLILIPLYTKEFTTEQFAIVDLLGNLVELFFPIVTLSISDSVFRFIIDNVKDRKNYFINGLFILITSNLIFFVISVFLYFIFDSNYIFYFQFLFITYSFKGFFSQLIRGLGKVKIFALSGIINAILLLIFNIIFISLMKIKIEGYFLAQIIANLLTIGYLLLYVNLQLKNNNKINFETLKKMLNYSIPLIPNTLAWWFVNIFNRYLILFFHGANIAGLFSAAGRISGVINLVSQIFQQAWQYSSAKEYNSEDRDLFYSWVLTNYSIIVFIFGSIFIGLSPLISQLFLSTTFQSAFQFIPFLFLSAIIGSFCYFFGTLYMASKSNKTVMNSTLIGAISNIILSLIFTKFNAFGAVFSIFLSYCIILSIRIKYLINIKININYSIWFPSLIILFVQAVFITFDKSFYLLYCLISFILIIILNFKTFIKINNIKFRC